MFRITPFRIVALYVALSVVWITTSDLIVAAIAQDTRWYAVLSIVKGWLFIAVTGALLFGLIRRYAERRNRAEETLRESEARFRDLAESLPQTVFEIDLSGRILYVNQAGLRAFGSGPGSLDAGLTISDILAEEDRQRAQDNMTKRLRGEVQGQTEYTAIRKDGTRFPITIHSVAIVRKGVPVGLRGILVDMTERQQADRAIRESEEKYRFVVEHAKDGVIIAQDGMIRYANRTMSAIAGYSVEELTSRPFTDFLHPDDRDLVLERHLKRIQGEIDPTFTYTFRLVRSDGGTVWIETRGAMSTWNGKPATINFLADITDRRRAEQERLQAEKLTSIGILAGGIAHDFNNILTGILANISIVRPQMKDERLALRLSEAEAASLRARSLTQQLLTFSRGGAPVRTVLDPGPLVRESATFALRGRAGACDVRIAAGLWGIEADEGQISQVVNNLVINANQAMAGAGTVVVEAVNREIGADTSLPVGEGPYITITVSDQGEGIPPENIPRIFDPYFTTKQEGSGLGLAICYSIVKNHGGTITVASEPGKGSTFTVYLPARGQAAAERDADAAEPLKGKGRILVMDDQEMIRNIAEAIIEGLGFDVVCVADGRSAIKAFQQAASEGKPFEVLILDLTVPGGMGGQEALRELLLFDPGVKAIVSSGYHNDPIMANFREHGFRDVITKPYNQVELSRVIARVLGNESGT
jgi:PAS domain S-box-containing protein